MKPKMNTRRLRAVARRILKYPDTYDQSIFIEHDKDVKKGNKPPGLCGTQACIAGHAVILDRKAKALKMRNNSIYYRARIWLGLTKAQAHTLFLVWPFEWELKLENVAMSPKKSARVANDYIKAFIKAGGDFTDDDQ